VLDQDQDPVAVAAVAAGLELIVVIAVTMAVDGAISQPLIVQNAVAVFLTPLRVLRSALGAAPATLLVTRVVAANGGPTVPTVATMVQGGVISPHPIAHNAQDGLTTVLLSQGAGELNSVVLPYESIPKVHGLA